MIWRAVVIALLFVTGCAGCGEECHCTSSCGCICSNVITHCIFDVPPTDADVRCNPLTQAGCAAGEKCTWLLDALVPQYVGHIGCAPEGTANTGDACMYGPAGATGYDWCVKGLVCSDYRGGIGKCAHICDQQGGLPQCDALHVCVTDPELFDTGDTSPPAAGICSPACDPFADNDFDGSGSASAKTGSACGSSSSLGCYGYPSLGTPPATAWACMRDINEPVAQPLGLRHRVRCSESNGCAEPGPTLYMNSCNQGYLPLLRESTTVSTAICTALCKPKNCFAGNCGPNDENRLGEAPHRCTNSDRVGTFDTTPNGEHCRFIWSFEIDNGNFVRSPSSDTVGFCFDHSKYLYDSDNNNTPDTPYPPCASLPDGFGSGTTFGAGDLGCVDTTHVQFATGKPRLADDLRPLRAP